MLKGFRCARCDLPIRNFLHTGLRPYSTCPKWADGKRRMPAGQNPQDCHNRNHNIDDHGWLYLLCSQPVTRMRCCYWIIIVLTGLIPNNIKDRKFQGKIIIIVIWQISVIWGTEIVFLQYRINRNFMYDHQVCKKNLPLLNLSAPTTIGPFDST